VAGSQWSVGRRLRDGSCGQAGPPAVASRTLDHGPMGCGAANRSARP
jgi:hypothetical protein